MEDEKNAKTAKNGWTGFASEFLAQCPKSTPQKYALWLYLWPHARRYQALDAVLLALTRLDRRDNGDGKKSHCLQKNRGPRGEGTSTPLW